MNHNLKSLFLFALFAKLFLALLIPLTLDEYYYLIWGQNPQLSYFDHPPMTGWLMSVGNFFKHIADGAIRWPFIVLTHGTLYLWYLIVKDHLSPKQIYFFLLVALLNPLWGCGVFIATPDIPLLFFWTLSIYFTFKLFHNPTMLNYAALGASLGLGFLSKYQIVLFVPCLALFIWNKKAYRYVITPKVLISFIFGLIFSLPVLIWNYQHEWISFDFQWNHGMKSTDWKWFWPLEYFFGQLLIIFPIFAILAFKNNKKDHSLASLKNFVIFPLLFFLYSSFKSHVEANWTIMVYPSLYALAFINISNKELAWIKKSVIFWSLVITLVFSLLLFPGNEKIKKLRLFEAQKFNNVLEFSKQHQNILPFSYQMTSYLSFHLNENFCKFPKYGRKDFFNFKKECRELPDHFYFILPNGYIPPIENDFIDYQIVNTTNIDDRYFALEVRKK